MARNGFATPSELIIVLWLATLAVSAATALAAAGIISGEAAVGLITGSTVGPLTYVLGHRRAIDSPPPPAALPDADLDTQTE